ncbi:VTT domain-containing protein [Marinobacter bryozoorum]|uniref:TVP38/TMEM64 family protein n=1 Tax=Marinobacter bryozoorum TaxID=256324 RepID=UPI0020063276|nr:VTT domain-containing protein [Marinobacter bryozoorum]
MRRWARFVIFLAITAAGITAIRLGWLDVVADQTAFRHRLVDGNIADIALISLAGLILTGFGGPRQLLAFASGFALGPAWGALYSTTITLAGAVGCFYVARWFLRPALKRQAGSRLASFDKLTRDNPFLKVVMIRLMPVGSNLITNLLAGSSDIRLIPFAGGSVVGYLPQMVVFAMVGAGFGRASEFQLVLGMVMFVIAAALGLLLFRTHRNRQLSTTITHLTAQTDR